MQAVGFIHIISLKFHLNLGNRFCHHPILQVGKWRLRGNLAQSYLAGDLGHDLNLGRHYECFIICETLRHTAQSFPSSL